MCLLKEFVRMCSSVGVCSECPIAQYQHSAPVCCPNWVYKNYDKAVEIIAEWTKNHPKKTYAQDFFEKFPNAARTTNGAPVSCWGWVYTKNPSNSPFCANHDCYKCWNRIFEE